ncbi:hypothetical protein LCGC14_0513930 [marine sediment metagenome]|uniref:Uncharacterized protein n=1 Tax=marine sediment metagenome TaxID=412755 RepID=A0A0F9UM34_9ZZZZ
MFQGTTDELVRVAGEDTLRDLAAIRDGAEWNLAAHLIDLELSGWVPPVVTGGLRLPERDHPVRDIVWGKDTAHLPAFGDKPVYLMSVAEMEEVADRE